MSSSGRVVEFLTEWRDGHGKPHVPSCGQWGGDDCPRCTADLYDPWEAFVHAAWIRGIPGYNPAPKTVSSPQSAV